MLYTTYEMQRNLLASASMLAGASAEFLQNPANPLAYFGGGPLIASALEVFAHAAAARGKPEFGLATTLVDGLGEVAVSERIEAVRPFGQLRHFLREGAPEQPKLLIVAPMSGHYATLLRGTVQRMLPGHDVWITDWADARQVPLHEGRFDFDDYVDYLIDWLAHIGPNAHVLAVCQPTVPAYAAACLMADSGDANVPSSLTMMGGPIDTRMAPTVVNELAVQRPLSWFQQNVIQTVPMNYPGAGRRVYPGFLQLAGFMAMNFGNHLMSHWGMFRHLVEGDDESADATKAFYEEYRSVCDMSAEFYLQTIESVFQKHLLPKGELTHRGRLVDPGALKTVPLLAIEGEKDDISGLGQTKAALTIARNLPDTLKKYYMARNVGHYGIFNGSKWRNTIAPVVEDWIATHNR